MNSLHTEEDIVRIIQKDEWMMQVLKTVKNLSLPDWWIGAGFVRSKVWDYLHDNPDKTPTPDIDVIYFNSQDISETTEKNIKEKLLKQLSQIRWQVKNQARMHILHNDEPYKSSIQGLSRWVETATCVGVKLDEKGKLILAAPLGITDLINLVVRPNPTIKNDPHLLEKFKERINSKNWHTLWPKLTIHYS